MTLEPQFCMILPRSALEEVFNLAQSHAMQMPERNPQHRMAIANAFRECRKAVEPLENPVLEQSQSDDTEANRTVGRAGRPRGASGPNSGFDSRDGGQS